MKLVKITARPTKKIDEIALARAKERANSPRTHEQIFLVIDRYKSRLLSIYQRALRGNPSLRGQVVFEIAIEATGNVSMAKVLSSELNDTALEKKIATQIMTFKFGAQEVEKMFISIPIDFYPS